MSPSWLLAHSFKAVAPRISASALVSTLALFLAQYVQAQQIWDGSTSAIWDTPTNWSDNNQPNSTGEAALFNTTGSAQPSPNVNADVPIGQIQYAADATSYNITGSSTLTLGPATSFGGVGITAASGSANQTISANIVITTSQTWNIGGTTSLTVSGVVNDSGVADALTKGGTGTLILSGNNSYDAGTVLNAGTLIMSGDNANMSASTITINAGMLRATTNANALGDQNTVSLAGGNLELANDTGLNFARPTTVSSHATITSDRLTAEAGVTHTLGTLGIGTQTLNIARGANVSSGTAGITFGNVTLSGNPTFSTADGAALSMGSITSGTPIRTLTFTGSGNSTVTGEIFDATDSGNTTSLTKSGTGTLILSAANTYQGTTTVSGGVLRLNNATALPGGINSTTGVTESALTLDGGVIGLGAGNFTRALGTGDGQVQWTGSGGFAAYTADRTVNLGGSGTPSGVTWNTGSFVPTGSALILGASDATNAVTFQNPIDFGGAARTVRVDDGSAAVDGILSGLLSNGGLTKTGAGTLTLSAANTYTGTTTVIQGTLQLGANNRIANTSNVVLAGGTLATGGFNETVGTLTLSSNSVIDMGAGSSILTFASIASWNATLSVWNWTGSINTAGGTDQLRFTTPSAPGSVQFYSDSGLTPVGSGGAFIGDELVPVPEPGAILAALLLLVPVGWRERRALLRIRQVA